MKPARGNAKLVTPENNVSYKDESYLIDPLLEKTFNDIADIDGFYFGRFDIRVQDMHNFITKGEGFKIMEVNVGAHSMALQAFDRRYNIFQRYAILAKQLQLAFAIARKNLHSPHDVLQEYQESKRVITKFIRKNVEIFNSLNKGE